MMTPSAMPGRISRFRALAALFVVAAFPSLAHDIPADATVQAFVKPEGQRLLLMVRVPLKTMRDVDFPEKAGGYLDVARLTPQLPDAAMLWMGNFVEMYE